MAGCQAERSGTGRKAANAELLQVTRFSARCGKSEVELKQELMISAAALSSRAVRQERRTTRARKQERRRRLQEEAWASPS